MNQRPLLFLLVLLAGSSCASQPTRPAEAVAALPVKGERRGDSRLYADEVERRMIEAAFGGGLDVVRSCLGKGARINARYGGDSRYFKGERGGWPVAGHNWTALMAAVENDRFAVATFLIAKGADVKMHDGWGGTPLYSLAEKRSERDEYVGLARQLIKAGADVNAKTGIYIDGPSGETVLHRAVGWGHTELVKLLIQNGAAVNAKTSKGATPMDYLYQGRNDEAIRTLLLAAGARPGTRP